MKTRFSKFLHLMIRLLCIAVFLAPTSLISLRHPARAQTTDTNWALQFNGTPGHVELAKTADIIGADWETTKSVNLWLKPFSENTCADPSLPSCDTIFGDKPRSWGITIGWYSDALHTLADRIWVWNYDGVTTSIGIPYTPNEWVNIALVHDGGVLRAYKNGVLAGSAISGATVPFQPDTRLYLGGITAGPSQILVFHGLIDEVHIWDRPLSQDEIIQQMYQATITDTLGLKAYYLMSDGPTDPPDPPRTTLTDDSQFDWNGTILDGVPPDIGPDGHYAEFVEREPIVIPDPPVAPSNLSALAHLYYHVDQTWIDNSTDEFSFDIERCTGMGCSDFNILEIILDSPGTGEVTYVDPNVSIGNSYCYRVRAANTGGESDYSNVACAIVPIPVFLPQMRSQ
jgi:hypothetical protein